MAERRISELRVENFRSLRQVILPLGPVNVLIGPNGAGKTNVLNVFAFLADIVRIDLGPALEERGGLGGLLFRGGDGQPGHLLIGLEGSWSSTDDDQSDAYTLIVQSESLERNEIFDLGLPGGRRRRIWVDDERAMTAEYGADEPLFPALPGSGRPVSSLGLNTSSSGLSTLPRLSEEFGGREVAKLADFLTDFRVFDVDVSRACIPSRASRSDYVPMEADASNLAGFLLRLRESNEDAWERLQADAMEVLPQLEALDFDYPFGAAHSVAVVLRERGLREATPLFDASYGTIRLLGLLAMLYDPNPPALTCVEEIDHGLHPQALELLVERVREASEKTQFIIATHSPALADRLKPEEIVVCERADDGSSLIPAIPTSKVKRIVEASEGVPLGELWLSGVLECGSPQLQGT